MHLFWKGSNLLAIASWVGHHMELQCSNRLRTMVRYRVRFLEGFLTKWQVRLSKLNWFKALERTTDWWWDHFKFIFMTRPKSVSRDTWSKILPFITYGKILWKGRESRKVLYAMLRILHLLGWNLIRFLSAQADKAWMSLLRAQQSDSKLIQRQKKILNRHTFA